MQLWRKYFFFNVVAFNSFSFYFFYFFFIILFVLLRTLDGTRPWVGFLTHSEYFYRDFFLNTSFLSALISCPFWDCPIFHFIGIERQESKKEKKNYISNESPKQINRNCSNTRNIRNTCRKSFNHWIDVQRRNIVYFFGVFLCGHS